MKGPQLKKGQMRLSGSYQYHMDATPTLSISKDTTGHVVPTHLWEVQTSSSINFIPSSYESAWEAAVYMGGASNDSTTTQAKEIDPSSVNTSLKYLKAGMGLRGLIYQHKNMLIGFNTELEVARRAYEVQISLITDSNLMAIDPVIPMDDQRDGESMNFISDLLSPQTSPQVNINKDYTYTITPRLGVYGSYAVVPWLSLQGGVATQLSSSFKGIEQSDCSKDILELKDCESQSEDFPISYVELHMVYYGGVTAQMNSLYLNLQASTYHSTFNKEHASIPVSFNANMGTIF